MRLLRIRLTDFRGVADRELEFAEQGVTVLVGPNESGKSSTIEAFGLLLDELDSSKKEAVRSVRPRHSDASPQVEAEFLVGGYHLVYRKRWHRPLTELRVLAPVPETLTGREAHERVTAILHQAMDYELFKALRVLQDKPFDVDRIAGSVSLRAALDAAAGGTDSRTDSGDGAEDTLVQRVEKEFGRYFTPGKHQPTGEYRAAQEAHAAAVTAADELNDAMSRVEADAERHGTVAARLAHLQRRMATDRAAAEELRATSAEVETLRRRRDEATGLVERAERDAELAARAWETRQELVLSVEKYAGELETARADIAAHAELRSVADTRRGSALAMHQAADEAHRRALRLYQEAEADHRWKRDEHELERVKADREALADADRDVAAAQAEQAATEIDDRLVDRIDAADRAASDARTKLEITAATVRIERLGAAPVTVSGAAAAAGVPAARAEADGAASSLVAAGSGAESAGAAGHLIGSVVTAAPMAVSADEPIVRRLTDPLVIEAEGALRVTLNPGASERELRAELDAAESTLAALCAQAGVRDLASARIRLQRHAEARASLDAAKKARKKLSKDPSALADDQARLEARIEDHRERRDPSVLPPADRDEAETVAEHRRAESEETAANLELAAAALARAQDETNRLAAEAENLRGRADALVAEHEAARSRLAEARAAASDDAVGSRDTDAAKALATAAQDRAAHEAAYREAEPDQVAVLLANAQAVVGRTEAEIADARAELQHLAGRLDTVGDDLADRLRDAEARRDAAERERTAVTARAEAASLLRETLLRRRAEAAERYQRPFKEQVEKFGRLVFGPSFGVTVDSELRVSHRTLDGRTDPYAELSTGAREAVAMCVRLACAALVGPDGGVPVLIDDALGAADPGRRDRLGALLSHAGTDSGHPTTPPQIIVFTCDPDRYHHVGSAQVRHLGHNGDRENSPAA